MSYKCQVKEQATRPTLVVRTRTSVKELGKVLGDAYGAIAQYLCELGEQPAGPPFAAYYNQDMQDLDVEIGFPVARELPHRGDIRASQIPGGRMATCLYTGPYTGMAPAYTALSQWMQENRYQPTGVAYEVYLSDPGEMSPEELQTEIVFPLK
jgi:effector-binding domain-containing protein